MKKTMYQRLQLRLIGKTKSRFLSVLLIIFIGTAFFAGLRVTPYAMKNSTNEYLQNYHFVDISIMTTYGITNEDIIEINKLDSVDKAVGAFQFDALGIIGANKDGITVYSYSKDNDEFYTPYLVEGSLPNNNDECLIDALYASNYDLKINDSITIKNNQYEKAYVISGFVKDTRYIIYHTRGVTTYGTGSSEGFVLIPIEDCFDFAIDKDLLELVEESYLYNQLLINLKDVEGLNYFESKYEEIVKENLLEIEEYLQARLDKRYESIIRENKELIVGPEQEYLDGLATYEKERADFDLQIQEAKLQIAEGRIQVLEGKKTLASYQTEYQNGLSSMVSEIENLQKQIDEANKALDDLSNNEDQSVDIALPASPNENNNVEVDEVIDNVQSTLSALSGTLDQVSLLFSSTIELELGKLELDRSEIELDIQEQKLQTVIDETNVLFDEAKLELDAAKIKIDEAYGQLEEIPEGTIYSFTLFNNSGTSSYAGDSDRIGALAEYFPLMFFLVAALVSLTTMTRMVEEQRSQNGTLRALGYTKLDIIIQYILYGLLATLIGSIMGVIVGCIMFPNIIYGLYTKMMYDVPVKMVLTFNRSITILTIVIAVFTCLIATLGSCIKELNLVPVMLMRPKAPKLGKRIFLEKIPFLWKRFSFNQKVTARNILRYKKRFFMSLIGIAGCTALLVAGFGIKYSIVDMITNQFDELWLYDSSIYFSEELTQDDGNVLLDELKTKEIEEGILTYQKTYEIKNEEVSEDINLIVFDKTSRLDHYFGFIDYKTKKTITINDNGIILTQKTAETFNVKVGDEITLIDGNENYKFEVAAITKNYIGNYAYASKNYYETIMNEPMIYNSCFTNLSDEVDEDKLASTLIDKDEIIAVSFTAGISEDLVTQMNSIDLVVWVLILSAGLLAFVVIYNLTNININERITEIATIKVLGFYNKEVYDYVFRENKVLTVLGTILGLFMGTLLHQFIIRTVEIGMGMFERNIRPLSFLYASVLTILFTYIINFLMRGLLKKVNMIESLKSIE